MRVPLVFSLCSQCDLNVFSDCSQCVRSKIRAYPAATYGPRACPSLRSRLWPAMVSRVPVITSVPSDRVNTDPWTLESVREVVDSACAGDEEAFNLVSLFMDTAHARVLVLVKSFLGDEPASPAHCSTPTEYLSYVSGGSIGEPRIQPDYVELLNNLLKDIVVNHPKLHYYLPPYTDEEKWKRCIADYFWVFIDR